MRNFSIGGLAALVLCACGGGGSDSSPPPPAAPAQPPDKRTGYFLNIKGVRYKSCGGYEGFTGDRGAFNWAWFHGRGAPDCLVTFWIGPWQLGYPVLLIGQPTHLMRDPLIITPYDLIKYDHYAFVGDDRTPDPNDDVARKNILTTLESLNARPNSRGVIEISTETDQFAQAAGWSIPFAAPDFRERAMALFGPANKTLVETTQAVNDYAPTVNCRNTGLYDGSGNAGKGPDTTDYKGNSVAGDSIDLEMNGLATPDGNVWLSFLKRVSYFKPLEDYDRLSGSVTPGPFGLEFDAVGSVSRAHFYFEDGFHLQSWNIAPFIIKEGYKIGQGGLTHDQRASWYWPGNGELGATPHWFELPELKFAGRANETYLLSLEVYADNTVRATVFDANEKAHGGYLTLLNGSIVGDIVTAEGSRSPTVGPSFKLVGTIDRANLTVIATVTMTTPEQPEPQPYMEITAPGCVVFPNLDAT